MTEKLSTEYEQRLLQVKQNYDYIMARIAEAAEKSGRKPEDIKFLAATKTVSYDIINYAISLGLKYIGENKVQELNSKYDDYKLGDCELHLIGHLQTNKVKQIVGKVSMIQSVDSIKLAKEIAKVSSNQGITTDVLIEVNIGREENKTGLNPDMLYELLGEISHFEGIKVRVLMAIPPICAEKTELCKYFEDMHNLFVDISGKTMDNISMDYLSMGMSADYYEAILCGANMVRIGSGLFGARSYT